MGGEPRPSLQSIPSLPPQTPPTADVPAQHDPCSPAKEPAKIHLPPRTSWVQPRAPQLSLSGQELSEAVRAPACGTNGKPADGDPQGAVPGQQTPRMQDSKGSFPAAQTCGWGSDFPDLPLTLVQGAGLCGNGGVREPEPALMTPHLGLPAAVKEGAGGPLVSMEQEVEEEFIQAALGQSGQAVEVGVASVTQARGAAETPVPTPVQGSPARMVKMGSGFQVVHNSPSRMPLVPTPIPMGTMQISAGAQGSQAPQGHWDQNGIPVYTVGTVAPGPSQPSNMTTAVHWMPVQGPSHGCYQAPLPQGPQGPGIAQVLPADMAHMQGGQLQAFPPSGDRPGIPEGALPQGPRDTMPQPCYLAPATHQAPPHMAPVQFSGPPSQCPAPLHPGSQGPADLSPQQRMQFQPVTWPVHGDVAQSNMQLTSSAPSSQPFDQGLQPQGTTSFPCQSPQGVPMLVERQPAIQGTPGAVMQARGPFPEGTGGQIVWGTTGHVVSNMPQGQPVAVHRPGPVHVAPVGLPVPGSALQEPMPLQAFEGGMPIGGSGFHSGPAVQYYTHSVPSNGPPQGHPVPHPGQPVFVSGPGANAMPTVRYWTVQHVDPSQACTAPRPLQHVPSLQTSTAPPPTTGRKRRVCTRRAPRIVKGRDPSAVPAAGAPANTVVQGWPPGTVLPGEPQPPAVVHVPVPPGVTLVESVGPVGDALPECWGIQRLPLQQVCPSGGDPRAVPHVNVPQQQPEGVSLGTAFGSRSPREAWSGEWSPTASFLAAPLPAGEVLKVLPASPRSASTSSWQSQSRRGAWPASQPLRDRGMSPEWTASADSLAIGSLSVSSLDGAAPGDNAGAEVLAGAGSLTPSKSAVWAAYFEGRASMADYGDLLCELMLDIHSRLEDLLMPMVCPHLVQHPFF